jgi:hypothetical protein
MAIIYTWLVEHNACPCALSHRLGKLCGWLEQRYFND